MKPLEQLTRRNIRELAPYSCARNEYSGKEARVYLDANESPYHTPYNRYPDPLQTELKAMVGRVKGIAPEHIFIGNGSDEAIDLMYRCFAEPGKDNVVAMEPTYGMYKVCADINDVEYRAVTLDPMFHLNAGKMLAATDDNTKIIWLCSPNNPSGNSMDRGEMEKIISGFEGLVVVDEAYSDFARQKPLRGELGKYGNMVVLNTMSKAWGSAAIRMGMAFASKEIIALFTKVKYPYNVSTLTQRYAMEMLRDPFEIDREVRDILRERDRLMDAFAMLPICKRVYPSDANFFLTEVTDAVGVYRYLVGEGIIVRDRHTVTLCGNCLRITVGTKNENTQLLAALRR